MAVLPLWAIEQHGPHLAVSTDSAIITWIAETAEKKLFKEMVLCPTQSFGSSHHHLKYPGTMSLAPELYTRLIIDLIKSLTQGGFRRIILLNGHGGNITPVRQALSVLGHELDDTVHPNIALATYWEMPGKTFAGEPPLESPALSHACEYETSVMLYLYPERVNMKKAKRFKRPPSNGYVSWEDEEGYRGVSMFKCTHFISDLGGSGAPQLATRTKGKYLTQKSVETVIEFVRSFKKWPLMKDLRHGKK